MIRLLVWALILYIVYRIVLSLTAARKPTPRPIDDRGPDSVTHRDPVCGIYVSEEQAVIGRYDGQRHYFCSIGCLEKYREQLKHS